MRLSRLLLAQPRATRPDASRHCFNTTSGCNDANLKSRFVNVKRDRQRPLGTALAIAAATLMLGNPALAGKPTTKGGGSGKDSTATSTYSPLALTVEDYYFRYGPREDNCLGEDDELAWKAIGGLKPGESFTFTPQYPGCVNHAAAVTVNLSWDGSELALSSVVPDQDMYSADPSQKGKEIIAASNAGMAQLCMFPRYNSGDALYTVKVTNVGSTTATNIVLDGRSDNDWAINFYNRCMNADADSDGWNDSLEHSMATLLYSVGYVDGVYQPYILWGSNYLKARVDNSAADDEIDSSPVDFNDDGVVNNLDVEEIGWYIGEGNGIPQSQISPNPSDPGYLWTNSREWRRYDVDGDGYVGQSDIDIVSSLVGRALPMTEDIIAPTGRVMEPEGGSIAKGSYYQIKGHVWDNAAVTKVEYLVDGRIQCTATDPVPSFGFTSPFHYCWWDVPKRGAL
ncbi:dockerin type I domain-containing protein [Marinobacterium aestuariivivens]|uniref:Dockerin type I domain-containing protein n=1 Tax=Marinobacterium aestuariivivens TaxID=1698799 RepID=A0ABW1ZTY2_9GAMM